MAQRPVCGNHVEWGWGASRHSGLGGGTGQGAHMVLSGGSAEGPGNPSPHYGRPSQEAGPGSVLRTLQILAPCNPLKVGLIPILRTGRLSHSHVLQL